MPDGARSAPEPVVDAVLDAMTALMLRRFRSSVYARLQPGVDVPVRDGTYPMLVGLASGGLSVTALAEASGVDRTTTSRQAAVLVDGGLVRVEADPGDRRAGVLTLTAEGERAAGRLRADARRFVVDFLASLEPEDRAAAGRILPALVRAAGPVEPTGRGEHAS
ncbi:MarR family winged helix-turn-helix transcriptional regulator [Clavibacter sp. km1a]|uniref:MarR family winged helix-turn-helix transcriptional regulator n=1 Tax=Clavibacter sp. km1a TaxID=3459136 RepID=UPI0040437876